MPSKGERLRAMQARHRHTNFLRMIEYLGAHPCADCHRRRTAVRANHRKHLLVLGLPLPAPERPEMRRVEIPHGGVVKGRRGCGCDPCRNPRTAYALTLRAARRQGEGGESSTDERGDV